MSQEHIDVAARIERAVARALNVPVGSLSRPLRMGSTPGWDSMGHMMVVMEIEREFGVRIPTARLPELLDVASIAKAIAPTA